MTANLLEYTSYVNADWLRNVSLEHGYNLDRSSLN